MHKERLCAKKLIKGDLNLVVKTMFFLKTRRTLPKNPKIISAKVAIAEPINEYFWLLKHVLFIPTSYNIIHKYV